MTIRIIPAYAGSTTFAPAIPVSRSGSSPHTRGAPDHPAHSSPTARIIPAYAGSTLTRLSGTLRERDHPRIRGEHDFQLVLHVEFAGSSPHTRGARSEERIGVIPGRIIPAYAGSTPAPTPSAAGAGDHPRIRGEHVGWAWEGVKMVGSSPHTRGALALLQRTLTQRRIIPAYAGSTLRLATFGTPARDHPRIRGEHTPGGGFISPGCGSSPHTRGAHPRHGRRRILDRIIPAYAGSTVCWSIPCAGAWDHPRIRGEHGRHRRRRPPNQKSSPHTRGARRAGLGFRAGLGIIPAYAGSTSLW